MECLHPKYLAQRDITVPCGRCAFCAATKRSDWTLRLAYESRMHTGSKFVTLTYANNNLTWRDGYPQLVKADLQNFFKRLRRDGHQCRYFAVGEYGSKTLRPHYHIILYGDVPDDAIRKAWSECNKRTSKYYLFGHVHIGNVTVASIQYCLGYVVNGYTYRIRKGHQRPFTVMSRGRGKVKGLGCNYLTPAMVEWHKSGRKNYAILDGQKRHLPRYYKVRIFSRLDLLRIAVRDAKEALAREVAWLRHPLRMKMRDPIAYRDEQRKRAAQQIRMKCKEVLTI